MKNRILQSSLALALFLLPSLASFAQGLPPEARRLAELREQAISRIDEKYIAELEKIKITYTKRGDLDSANAIESIIAKLKGSAAAANSPVGKFLAGEWKGDGIGASWSFDGKGGGVFNEKLVISVSWDAGQNLFRVKTSEWTSTITPGNDPDKMEGRGGDGKKFTLTRVK